MDRRTATDSGAGPAPFPIKAVETLLFATGSVAAGTFRCAPKHPMFADSGPCSTYCFVFPRTSVWIRHAASAPFVGNPSLVALYNEGQEYSRRPLSADGDRSDWFAVAPAILEDALATLDVAPVCGTRRLFPVPFVLSDARLYLAQRQLQERLARSAALDPLRVEETILALLERVLAPAAVRRSRDSRSPTPQQRAVADHATALLGARVGERLQLADLAAAVGCSVFHLCRAFRRATGTTIHQYRSQLRLRHALEPLADSKADLTTLALDLGYCSHSHFTAAFRHAYALTPSAFISSIAR